MLPTPFVDVRDGFVDLECCLAVFSKSYCPYCKATKQLLSSVGAQYYAIELDQVGEWTTHLSFSPALHEVFVVEAKC